MPIRLTFLGAAENVTGARYLLEVGARRLLVDCGLYQERDLAARNWDPFPVPPATLDAVLLTHAHLDHSGYLPRLVRDGFRGPIYCTQATAEIAQIALQDSASLQVEDAKLKLKRHEREGRTPPHPEIPLYEAADVAACCALVHPVTYNDPVTPVPGVEATFQEVGHILGAAMIRLRMRTDGTERSLLFSGDIGRWNRPIIRDPQLCPPSDYVVMESTYGDRLHEDPGSIADLLCRTICATRERGGNILIPSFAIERAQDVLYYLNELLQAQRIPHLLVFVDSPMAVSVSEVFEHHRELLDEDMIRWLDRGQSPFHFKGLRMVRSVEDSKAINHIKGTVVIIAGSGMCTGGRIKHHLVQNIESPASSILFVGYQAGGTLGRAIVSGAPEVRILGALHPVKASVVELHGFSAHADRDELLRWAQPLAAAPPRRVFVNHGEPEVSRAFAATLHTQLGVTAEVAKFSAPVVLE